MNQCSSEHSWTKAKLFTALGWIQWHQGVELKRCKLILLGKHFYFIRSREAKLVYSFRWETFYTERTLWFTADLHWEARRAEVERYWIVWSTSNFKINNISWQHQGVGKSCSREFLVRPVDVLTRHQDVLKPSTEGTLDKSSQLMLRERHENRHFTTSSRTFALNCRQLDDFHGKKWGDRKRLRIPNDINWLRISFHYLAMN